MKIDLADHPLPLTIEIVDSRIPAPDPEPEPGGDPSAVQMAKALGRGVNAGGWLEAKPKPGDWKGSYGKAEAKIVAEAGFDHVRIPIRWDLHTNSAGLVPSWLWQMVDEAIGATLANDMIAIVNQHHFEALNSNASAQRSKFVNLWRQIAERYRGVSNGDLVFELINEPTGALGDTSALLSLQRQALAEIRKTNSKRVVMYCAEMNNHAATASMPKIDDPLMIGTFHYYRPLQFSHQGIVYNPAFKAIKNRTWPSNADDVNQAQIAKHFDDLAAWSKKTGHPIHLGEFGMHRSAPQDASERWTKFIRELAEARGFPWSYWDFNTQVRPDTGSQGFGLHRGGKWDAGLLRALGLA